MNKQACYISLFMALSTVYMSGCATSDVVAAELTAEQQAQLEAERAGHLRQTHVRFNALDKDEDGYISWEEFKRSGDRAFEHLDTNKDGRISKEDPPPQRRAEDTRSEAQKTADEAQPRPVRRTPLLRMPTTHSIEGLLALYDTNNNGEISREEYDKGRKAQFDAIDANGDGKLSYDEYVAEYAGRLDKRLAETRKALATKNTK
ncbi:EF-hand domain-containing protein [Chromatiaceae bacterium AAb-1]|nr:EF-hand domain-containing protein [Chromatiaceae bacterium AAb-1]